MFAILANEDLVRAMRIFKKRCLKAMSWFEAEVRIYGSSWDTIFCVRKQLRIP